MQFQDLKVILVKVVAPAAQGCTSAVLLVLITGNHKVWQGMTSCSIIFILSLIHLGQLVEKFK
jgi:hypothetical protein